MILVKIKNKCKHLPNLEEGAGFDLPEPRLYLEGRMKGQGGVLNLKWKRMMKKIKMLWINTSKF